MLISQKQIKILLVDDHKSFSDGLTMLIDANKSLMQVVGTATDRRQAIDGINLHQPDIVLLDVDLGDENGIEMLPELTKSTIAKFIILTGVQDAAAHQQAILNGARGVLLKTDSAQVILKAIEKVHRGEVWMNNSTLSQVLRHLTQSGADGNQSDDPESAKIKSLTAREREIIKVLIEKDSSTNKEIAESLFISDSTLKNHLTTIYSKLEIKNRIELFKYALKHNLSK